jgi:hypothetical protein
MNWALFLAIWGAVLSTLLAVLSFCRYSGDRARVKVKATFVKMIPDSTERTYLAITMTNVGRRPVYITACAGRFRKGHPGGRYAVILPASLPKMLNEGEAHTEYATDFSFIGSDLDTILVEDSTGKHWRISRANLKELLREAPTHLQAPRPR